MANLDTTDPNTNGLIQLSAVIATYVEILKLSADLLKSQGKLTFVVEISVQGLTDDEVVLVKNEFHAKYGREFPRLDSNIKYHYEPSNVLGYQKFYRSGKTLQLKLQVNQ